MKQDDNPFADINAAGARARRKYEDARACGDEAGMSRAGLALTLIGSGGQKRAQDLVSAKEHLIARYKEMNAENRMVLEALEEGLIRTHLNNVDTTEAQKALYRKFIAETDDLIERVRMWGLD